MLKDPGEQMEEYETVGIGMSFINMINDQVYEGAPKFHWNFGTWSIDGLDWKIFIFLHLYLMSY